MPEGHTVHRLARRIRADGLGDRVGASSPQGRFSEGAAAIDGAALTAVEAAGKHLFLELDGAQALHVHLGLFGRMSRLATPPPAPRGAVRLRLGTRAAVWDLRGPTACELLDSVAQDALLARIGPDPLRGDDPEPALSRIARSGRAVGALILDQRVMSGVGNVYRAEILFALRIDPHRPGRDLSSADREAMWETAVEMLAAGERSGRIQTVTGVPRRRLAVYRQGTCLACGGEVKREDLAGRPLHWCPACQR